MLAKSDPKKFPKKPELLWDKEADRMSEYALAASILAVYDPSGKFRREHNIKLK
jgi:hypothetical protein